MTVYASNFRIYLSGYSQFHRIHPGTQLFRRKPTSSECSLEEVRCIRTIRCINFGRLVGSSIMKVRAIRKTTFDRAAGVLGQWKWIHDLTALGEEKNFISRWRFLCQLFSEGIQGWNCLMAVQVWDAFDWWTEALFFSSWQLNVKNNIMLTTI